MWRIDDEKDMYLTLGGLTKGWETESEGKEKVKHIRYIRPTITSRPLSNSTCLLSFEPPCTGRYARRCEKSALYSGEPPTRFQGILTLENLYKFFNCLSAY